MQKTVRISMLFLIFFFIYNPFTFAVENFEPRMFDGTNKKKKKKVVKKTSLVKAVKKSTSPALKEYLPAMAKNVIRRGSAMAMIVPYCDVSQQKVVFTIYKSNLFFQSIKLDKNEIVAEQSDGTWSNLPEKFKDRKDLVLVQMIIKVFEPKQLELFPGKDRVTNAIVLNKEAMTFADVSSTYKSIKDNLSKIGIGTSFANECGELFANSQIAQNMP